MGKAGKVALLLVAIVAALALAPVQRLDRYRLWKTVESAALALRDEPADLSAATALVQAGAELGRRVSVPESRPEGKCRAWQRASFDSCCAVDAAVALTYIAFGRAEHGLRDWRYLTRVLRIQSVPCLAWIANSAIMPCGECSNKAEDEPPAHSGEVAAGLAGPHGSARMTGQNTRSGTCRKCRGTGFLIDRKRLQETHRKAVSLAASQARKMACWHAVPHALCVCRQKLLLHGGEAGRKIAGSVGMDWGTNAPALGQQENGEAADTAGRPQTEQANLRHFRLCCLENKLTYGPYWFRDGTRIGTGSNGFTLYVETNQHAFTLVSVRSARTFGPFEFTDGQLIRLPAASFLLALEPDGSETNAISEAR